MPQLFKKYTVTVGIPAYNEEKNIRRIIDCVLKQRSDLYLLEKIIIMADGCTDDTEKEARKAADKYPIIFIETDKERKGKAERLNQLYRLNASDMLVTFDADILLKEKNIIEKMLVYFKDEDVVAVGGNGMPFPGRNFVEKTAEASEKMWYEARKDYKYGSNIYNSVGCAFALRGSFVNKKYFPKGTTAEQQFIYLWAVQSGQKFIFAKEVIVYFRVPSTVKDLFIQASRSRLEIEAVEKYFKNSINNEYYIPFAYKIRAAIKIIVRHPLYGIMAIAEQLLLKFFVVKKDSLREKGMWEVAASTKDDVARNACQSEKKLSFRSCFFLAKRIALGLFYQFGKIFGINKNAVSVLCYHSISGADNKFAINIEFFEKQMGKISKHARFASLDEIMGILDGKKNAAPAVAITFDDGYKDIMKILPVAKKYKIPIAVFAVSDYNKINRKELDNNIELLDCADLKLLHFEGWTIGCHSATHANFKNLNEEKIKKEIINSKKTLEINLGFKIEYFAYPKGVFDGRIIGAAKSAGYKAAFSVLPGCVNSKSNRWVLPRTIIEKNHKASEFPAVYSPTSFLIRRLADKLNLWDRISKI